MKKLMIAACAVAFAAVAQAASISWSAASANYVTKDGAIQTASTAETGTFVLVALGTGTADWDHATVVSEGSVTYGSGKSGSYARAGGSYAWTYGAEGTPANGNIFGVMFRDGEGKLSKLAYADGSGDVDTTFTISGLSNNTYSGNFDFASKNYTTNVPEPTSAMLMLLGVAGLALRRKRS